MPVELVFARQERPAGLSTLEQVQALRDQARDAATTAATDALAEAMPRIETTISEAAGQAATQAAAGVAPEAAAQVLAQVEPTIQQAAQTAAQEAATAVAPAAADAIREEVEAAATQAASAAENAATIVSGIGVPLGNPMGWTFSRASYRQGWDAQGNIEELAPDQAQGGFDRTGRYLGALFNKAKRNHLPNPNTVGAAAGTFTGGASSPPFPTGWTTPTRNSGVRVDVTPIAALGRTGLRLRFYAPSALTAGTADAIEFAPRGSIPADASQMWTNGFFYRLVAGVLPDGTSFRSRILARNGSGGVVNNVNQQLTLDGEWRLAEHPLTTGAAVADITSGFQFSWATGVQPDVTIEIVGPQLVQGGLDLPVLPPLGALGPYERAQDMVTIPASVLGSHLSRARGSVFATVSSFYPRANGEWHGIVSLGDGTPDNVLGIAINPSFASVESRMTTDGQVVPPSVVAISAPAADSSFRVGLSWGDGQMQVFARGVAGNLVTIPVAVPVITQAMLGRFASAFGFDGSLSAIELRPAPIWGADGAAATA